MKRYEELASSDGTKAFHYGTHYSSAASVTSYLIRLQPFADLHCALQDGRFDLADRLFHSLGEEWKLASGEKGGDTGCVKEQVPEMYYLWELLLNLNHLELGSRQDGTACHHVLLPRWARGSAWRATRTMRQALESSHVSRELPGWIDLVFGCLQQGDGAAKALNLFLPATYIGAVDVASLDEAQRVSILSQIQLVGQTPGQLWSSKRHPHRSQSASVQTAPPSPLLGCLMASYDTDAQRLQPFPEAPTGFTVHGLLVSAGGERAAPLPLHVCALPRASLSSAGAIATARSVSTSSVPSARYLDPLITRPHSLHRLRSSLRRCYYAPTCMAAKSSSVRARQKTAHGSLRPTASAVSPSGAFASRANPNPRR